MSSTTVDLRTMNFLRDTMSQPDKPVQFYIDDYQRGYRWTNSEVKDLLDDIREFTHMKFLSKRSEKTSNAFYCLQPVIVTPTEYENGKAWKVIDGQQRLTTLYLIYSFYWATAGLWDKKKFHFPFELAYKNKQLLQDCLHVFKEKGYFDSEDIDKDPDIKERYEKDIDCHYVIEAYKCICKYFGDIQGTDDQSFMKKVFDEFVKIIWYELDDCDVTKEVEVFTKINMGKIPLTNAELIKAMLLQRSDDEDRDLDQAQTNIAVKWDEIEAQMADESFWKFLVNGDQEYATRIDFIFHAMARELNDEVLKKADDEVKANSWKDEKYYVDEIVNRDKFSFYVFSNFKRYIETHPEQNDGAVHPVVTIWNKVNEYYRMFKDWYKKNNWYHMIGFLICASTAHKDYDNIYTISSLAKLYREDADSHNAVGEGHKTNFENELRECIKKEVFESWAKEKAEENVPEILNGERLSKDRRNELKDKFVNDFLRKLTIGDCRAAVKNMTYSDERDKDKIKDVLLLYNIAYLAQSNQVNENKPREIDRFPFDKFKSENWDLEHINAVADEKPGAISNDTDENPRKQWLIHAQNWLIENRVDRETMITKDGRNVADLIDDILKKKYYLLGNPEGDFDQAYEAVIRYYDPDLNSESMTESDDMGMDNNSITNLTLLDSEINRSYGNQIFPVKRETILDGIWKDYFIPLCTRKVFLKGFPESNELLRWGKIDKKAYINDIVSYITDYLKLEDNEDEQQYTE